MLGTSGQHFKSSRYSEAISALVLFLIWAVCLLVIAYSASIHIAPLPTKPPPNKVGQYGQRAGSLPLSAPGAEVSQQ